MSNLRRNLLLVLGLAALVAACVVFAGHGTILAGLTALLALIAVIALRGNGWRTAALSIAALSASITMLDLLAVAIGPARHGEGLLEAFEPADWIEPDPDLGYRLRPNRKTIATSTFKGERVYQATYTVTPRSTRATPDAPVGADAYLFMGDSFVFGQGVQDAETLGAQFARLCDFKVQTVIFAAPGYGPNHLVRALEIDTLAPFFPAGVKAVITWIIPAQLARVLGEGEWLGAAPRYAMSGDTPRFTGSFAHNMWREPLPALMHLAADRFPFVRAIGREQLQEEQGRLFIGLIARLQAVVREKFDAPLLVIYSWPDEYSHIDYAESEVPQRLLVSIISRLRERGIPLFSVNALIVDRDPVQLMIPHDGHPSALTYRLVATALKRQILP